MLVYMWFKKITWTFHNAVYKHWGYHLLFEFSNVYRCITIPYTVYSGYSGHVYSGHSDIVATFPGTKYIYSIIFRSDKVHYIRSALYCNYTFLQFKGFEM